MQETYKMAGRLAAHAVLSISSGELLIPIYGYLTADGKTKMVRVVTDSNQEAMEMGEEMYVGNRWSAVGGFWVVDGFVTQPDVGKVDALILKICTYNEPKHEMQLVIPYRHADSSEGFAVFKPELVGLKNIERDALQPLMEAFYVGRDEHSEGAAIWKEHFQEEITSMSGFSGFSTQEWAELRDAPLAVFFMVAGADGDIDAKEVKAFEALFKESGKYPSMLMQRVMSELTPAGPQGRALLMSFMERCKSGNFFAPLYFMELNLLLNKNTESSQAEQFKADLLAFGKAVASSSGGFFGLGSKISKEEKATLAAIEALLSHTDLVAQS